MAKEKWSSLTIYIVESPFPDDLLDGRKEGEALTNSLGLIGCKSEYFITVNRQTFEKALLKIASIHEKSMPIIHISSHGNEQGIVLTSGELITWKELGDYLTPLNTKIMGGYLMLCLSSCYGLSMTTINEGIPYLILVSFNGIATWRETLVGFLTFYYILGKETDFNKATESARMASGNESFTWVSGKFMKATGTI